MTSQNLNRGLRLSLIKQIEELQGSRLLVYITGDRQGLETRISTDIFPMFHKHLMQIGRQKRIDLFLYSMGGITIAGFALVNLIREFCEEFNVIIPFKALSCATLITLGANKIIMTPMGQLSPIDPSVTHPLGPIVQTPVQPTGQIVPLNVEDVNAFIDLATKEVGLKEEESMKKVFELLALKINPVALGSVQRSREQIAFLASTLLKNNSSFDDKKIKDIAKILIRERFSHDYIISRKEAKEILGLNIIEPDSEFTKLIVSLYNSYSNTMDLDVPYNPETILGTEEVGTFTFNRAIIESNESTHIFRTVKKIRRVEVPQQGLPIPMIGYQEIILQEQWLEDNTI